MAMIHEQLYRSEDLAHVDFLAYVEHLTSHLMRAADAASRGIELRLKVEPISLPVDLAIPTGMILNEFVSNALEHAFPDGRHGCIDIEFHRRAGNYELLVRDNGVGLNDAAIARNGKSLGLKVVDGLIRQLDGALETRNESGASFHLAYRAVGDCGEIAQQNGAAKIVTSTTTQSDKGPVLTEYSFPQISEMSQIQNEENP